MKKRLICVFFQGASDGNVKTSRNIVRKSKNSEILFFFLIEFLNDRSDRSEPSRPIDRPTDPTDPKKKWGVRGGFAPPPAIFSISFLCFLYEMPLTCLLTDQLCLVATVCGDHAARLWNAATGEHIRDLHGHTDVSRSRKSRKFVNVYIKIIKTYKKL